jgi:hypothetical protein
MDTHTHTHRTAFPAAFPVSKEIPNSNARHTALDVARPRHIALHSRRRRTPPGAPADAVRRKPDFQNPKFRQNKSTTDGALHRTGALHYTRTTQKNNESAMARVLHS